MSRFAIRLTILTLGASALVLAPAVTAAKEKTSHSRHTHIKNHKWHRLHPAGGVWPGYQAPPVVGFYDQPGPVCPGIGRSFDCKIWPPPFADDPDRKTSRY
jgi:hypothetical protein